MPPRKKPTSTRQKKADIQLKRAIKRGDALPPDPKEKTRKRKALRRGPTGNLIGSAANPSTAATIKSARRLISSYIVFPPKFLEETKSLAAMLLLSRPISYGSAVYSGTLTSGHDNLNLSCPRRPKWRFEMSKKEVEHNEEAWFKNWLAETDKIAEKWQSPDNSSLMGKQGQVGENHEQSEKMPRSPLCYERNLEVWRQLWRVTEISNILLVLLDSRCPIVHFPPSLHGYLGDRPLIIVLTKVDITGPIRVEAWTRYLRNVYTKIRVVHVESYIEKEPYLESQGKKRYIPRLPITFRAKLVDAIRSTHAELLQPPEKVRSNPSRLQSWKPSVKQDVDWSDFSGTNVPKPTKDLNDDSELDPANPTNHGTDYLTIGLIGQPNVGKSSLLNALFGESRVRASKTPGKTKHFQTLFLTSDIRLVDCPGLVMPNLIPMELQVLCGMLPISRISAISACVHYTAERMPLERIYKLGHPSTSAVFVEDKRTWREGMKPSAEAAKEKLVNWTTMDILTAYANLKGWVTAKAGRPDVNRAGNAILRSLAEGKIAWAFWPPGTDIKIVAANTEEGAGIWIPRADFSDEESDETEFEKREDSEEDDDDNDDGFNEDEEIEDTDVNEDYRVTSGLGRFGALTVADNDEEE